MFGFNERRNYAQIVLRHFAILLAIAQEELETANEDSVIATTEGVRKLQQYEFKFKDLLIELGISKDYIDMREGYKKEDEE